MERKTPKLLNASKPSKSSKSDSLIVLTRWPNNIFGHRGLVLTYAAMGRWDEARAAVLNFVRDLHYHGTFLDNAKMDQYSLNGHFIKR